MSSHKSLWEQILFPQRHHPSTTSEKTMIMIDPLCKQTACLEEDEYFSSAASSTGEMSDETTTAASTIEQPAHLVVVQDKQSTCRSIHKIDKDDCVVGSKLGKGTFASVFSVQLKEDSNHRSSANSSSSSSGDDAGGSDDETSAMHKNNNNRPLRKKRHAMKMIRQSINAQHREAIASDLYAEAETLKNLPEHPNIIGLWGMSSNMLEDPQSPKSSAFLIFERLDGTLEDRLTRWSIRAVHQKKKAPRAILPRQKKAVQLQKFRDQQDRLRSCAMGIAKALNHLHQHGIVYLDLKPANVGFDYDGNVKLFDFGISQRKCEETGVGVHAVTGKIPKGPVGTPRYMAPEIARHAQNNQKDYCAASSSKYSFPADVFSFSILLWEVCTLEKPFGKFKGMDCLLENCQAKQQRPKLSSIVSVQLQDFLSQCWQEDPAARPTFASILKTQTLDILLEERGVGASK